MSSRPASVVGGLRRIDSRWRDLPLRTRLTIATAAAATLAIVAVIAVAYIAVRHELRGQIDSQLHRQSGEVQVRQRFGPDGNPSIVVNTGAGDIGGYSQVVAANGSRGAGGDRLPISSVDLRIATSGQGIVLRDAHLADRHVRLLTEPVPQISGYAVQIALPLDSVDHQLRTLAAAFVVLAAAGLGLTAFVTWGIVRRVTRPVRTLTEAAEQIATTRDLTLRITAESDDELGRLATTFNTMLDALERSLSAQRQLVTDASHELRTPLASLRTNVEVLNDVDRLSPDQRRAVLDGIVTQLDELTGLVADVVELARGEAPPSDHQDVALDELLTRAVERAERHWPAVRFRLALEPVVVRGASRRLDRAIANMLDNAGKFSPPGSTVGITLTGDGMLTVADQGPGVPPEALPHVFDRFYRADEARALPGSGLGLAIAHQVAEGHGGRIILSNGREGGAVATLTLPVVGDDGSGRETFGTGSDEPTADRLADAGPPMPVEESLFR
jgi:two-component system sensor histidine kinase MprB